MKYLHALVSAIALTVVLSGCKTPPAALDQANNGAALTVSLEAELREFRRVQNTIATARMTSVRNQRARLAEYEIEGGFDARIQRAAGNTAAAQLFDSLKELADSRAKDDVQLQSNLSELDAMLLKLIAPLPDSTKSLKATQEALANLGEELPERERVALVAAFAKDIRKGIEDNKKAIEAAERATASPTLQPAPAH